MIYSTATNSLTSQNTTVPASCSPSRPTTVSWSSTIRSAECFTSTTPPPVREPPTGAWEWPPNGRPIPILSTSLIAPRSVALTPTRSTSITSTSAGAPTLSPPPAVPERGHYGSRHRRVSRRHSDRRPHLVPLRHGRQQRQHPVLSARRFRQLATSVLGATSNGQHVLGASLSGSSITLDDIGLLFRPRRCALKPPPARRPIRWRPDAALHQPHDQWNGESHRRHQRDCRQPGRYRHGAHHLHRHGRAHRLRHLHDAHHVHHGGPASFLSAPVQRRGPRRLRHFCRRFLHHAAHCAARRCIFAR